MNKHPLLICRNNEVWYKVWYKVVKALKFKQSNSDYESEGRGFESLRAHHTKSLEISMFQGFFRVCFFAPLMVVIEGL